MQEDCEHGEWRKAGSLLHEVRMFMTADGNLSFESKLSASIVKVNCFAVKTQT